MRDLRLYNICVDACNTFNLPEDALRSLDINYIKDILLSGNIPDNLIKNYYSILSDTYENEDTIDLLLSIENKIVSVMNNGDNIFLYSNKCGNGKSSWGLRLLISAVIKTSLTSNRSADVFFMPMGTFTHRLRSMLIGADNEFRDTFHTLMRADMVLWDDLGCCNMTETQIGEFLMVYNERLNRGLSNIVTSNLSPKDISFTFGNRIRSRLCNTAAVIKFIGDDRRNGTTTNFVNDFGDE